MSTEIRTNRHGVRYYIEPSRNGWFIGLVGKNVHGGDDLHSGHWYQTRHQALEAIADYQGPRTMIPAPSPSAPS